MITIDIVPQGAVRMTNRGKWKSIPAQRYLNYKKLIGYELRKHFSEPSQKPIKVSISVYYPIPDSWSKKKKQEALTGVRMPIVKPDLDNVVKGIYDSCNGIAWKDDNQVVDEQSSKRYSDNPRIELEVEEIA